MCVAVEPYADPGCGVYRQKSLKRSGASSVLVNGTAVERDPACAVGERHGVAPAPAPSLWEGGKGAWRQLASRT